MSSSNGTPSFSLRRSNALTGLFFLSGFSSLIFESVFVRLLTYTFGNTAQAVSTVLAAFLGGLALGAFLIGRWADRREASLWTYGVLELMVGVYCLFLPEFFSWLTRAYVILNHQMYLGPSGLMAVRFTLASAVILPPASLMGGTLPIVARWAASGESDSQWRVARLYGWNTTGAALGTLLATYLFSPLFGVRGTIRLGCGLNFLIFCAVALTSTRQLAAAHQPAVIHASGTAAPASTQRRGEVIWFVGAFLTGASALGYEVLWTHIQAFTIGTTVYAFGIMLFTVLCGLAAGAHLVGRYLKHPARWVSALAGAQLLLGVAVLVTIPLWNIVPLVFSRGLAAALGFEIAVIALLIILGIGYRLYWMRRQRERSTWLQRNEAVFATILFGGSLAAFVFTLPNHTVPLFLAIELLRFLCAFCLLIIPAVLVGMSFPLLLNLASSSTDRVASNVGTVYAINTLGAVTGSVLTGFVFLGRFGSLNCLRGAAVSSLAVGLFLAFARLHLGFAKRLALLGGTAAIVLFAVSVQSDWDPNRMSSGSYFYFSHRKIDRILSIEDDVQGGLTTSIETGSTRTLLSNGKYQGNNTSEVPLQSRFAIIPILFTPKLERALVIGLGTGNTLRTVSLFPFHRVDGVELSPGIIRAARAWFSDVNGGVFDRDPRVRLMQGDGRNFLLLSRERYDLITVEITSIWLAGQADLYNREFYEIGRDHLSPGGILQQWLPLNNMSQHNLLIMLNTAAHVFPHVAVFVGAGQGLLVGSQTPLSCDFTQLERLHELGSVRHELDRLGIPSIWSLLGELMVYGESFRAVLRVPPSEFGDHDMVSSDLHPYLEYRTPLGALLQYDSVAVNTHFLESFRTHPLPAELLFSNLPSENERSLILGFASAHHGDSEEARAYLRRVGGASLSRAQAEIERISRSAAPRDGVTGTLGAPVRSLKHAP